MTEANTCNVCNPITKYDISEDQNIIRDQDGDIIDVNIEQLVRKDVNRFKAFGDISKVDFNFDEEFEIPNQTEEKLLARQAGRKPEGLITETRAGSVSYDSSVNALIEKGIYLPDSSFSDVSTDNDYLIFDELIKTLCCVTPTTFPGVSSSQRREFDSRVDAFVVSAGITPEKARDFWYRVIVSPVGVREAINRITNNNIPLTEIATSVSTSCLIRNRSPRTINISPGMNPVELNDSYVGLFSVDTNFRKLIGLARGFNCSETPTDFRFSRILNSLDSRQNKFNNPQNALDNVSSCFQQLLSAISQLIVAIVNYGTGGQPEHKQQIDQLPSVLNALENFIDTLISCLSDLLNLQIPKLRDIINLGQQIKSKVAFTQKYSKELKDIQTLAQPNPLFGDITTMLSTIKSKIEDIIPLITDMLSKIGGFSFAVSDPREYIENRDPGSMLGNFLSGIVLGQSIPTQKQTNNPLLKDPSYIGKAFFGEAAIALPAFDQVFSKKVAMFQQASGAIGSSSFMFQNTGLGGNQTLIDGVSKILTGSVSDNLGPKVKSLVETITGDVSNLLGSSINTMVELKREDNAIPVMISLAARISNDTNSPFDSKVFMDGWKIASYARSKLEQINPEYFESLNELT